ncbi:MAG TPA: protein kinase [Vicinamibacterales bacterium]|nr:protein kinase [Vicinamibacterales bacterium]
MQLTAGFRLGAYDIVAPLGAGGMGAVYRAHDARLDRDVAIKVLADSLARDESALARFEREAMSVAKLSHPKILAIFEFGEHAGTAFVVMELVDGETLRKRLEQGPIPPRKAVAFALQIAAGLGAAHARGIVHRDLKPENVMITRDDRVKILDFGLAKSAATQGDVSSAATHLAGTTPGTVLGTFAYMAPEQVRGMAVDHRTDIFAFGAVLHEMLSGERAFPGETAADTMTAILTKDPVDFDPATLAISPGLERTVRRCLEKSPDLRFQSASDLAFALETLTTSGSARSGAAEAITTAAAAAPARPARSPILPWAVAGVMTVIAAAGWYGRGATTPSSPRFEAFTRITELAGEETAPALSPDGTTIAYAVRIDDSWDIYTQRVGGRNATPILNDPRRNESGPAFSPDGAWIAFHESDSDGGIFVAGATGESVRRLTELGFHPAWSPDGTRIAFTTEEIFDPSSRSGEAALCVVDAAGGRPRRVVPGDAAQPSWSPSGDRFVYWNNTGGQRDLFTVPADGGERVALTDDAAIDWSPVWSPDGRAVYFASDRGGAMNLWRIAVDPGTGRALGAPEAVTMGAQATAGLPSFSKDGRRLAFRSRVGSVNPFEIPFDPVTLKAGEPRLLDARTNVRIPSGVSPDGSLVAFFSIGDRQEDIFIGPPGGSMRRVLDDAARDRSPVFTPDGRALVFYSNRTGQWQAWTIALDGSGLRQLTDMPEGVVYPFVSPGGDRLVFTASAARKVFEMPLSPGAQASEVPGAQVGDALLTPFSWSPDGLRLAGALNASSGAPIGVAAYDLATKATTRLSTDAIYGVHWLPDSRRVVYFTDGGWQLVVLDTVARVRTPVAVRLPAPQTNDVFAISADGRHIYYAGARAEADIWILERK